MRRDIFDQQVESELSNTSIKHYKFKYKIGDQVFYSPAIEPLEEIKYFLLQNSDRVQFNPKYKMRPDYLSYDLYGTVDFWFILMYINDVFSIVDFDLETIYIPRMSAIRELISQIIIPQKQNKETVS